MSPEAARAVYYAALGNSFREHDLDWSKPRVQFQCEMEAWKAVCEFVETPETMAALNAYKDAKADLRSHPDTIQRLWADYTRACRAEMQRKEQANAS